jgi:hypothetical protein
MANGSEECLKIQRRSMKSDPQVVVHEAKLQNHIIFLRHFWIEITMATRYIVKLRNINPAPTSFDVFDRLLAKLHCLLLVDCRITRMKTPTDAQVFVLKIGSFIISSVFSLRLFLWKIEDVLC